MRLAETVAPTDLAVIIEGETGSGKEYIARYIHSQAVPEKTIPLLHSTAVPFPRTWQTVSSLDISKDLLPARSKDKTGVFEEAHGGTLFLDEIGNLSYDIQVKLLRSLQEKSITRRWRYQKQAC